MKNLNQLKLSLILGMLVIFVSANAHAILPTESGAKQILVNSEMTVTIEDASQSALLTDIEYDEKTNKLILNTEKEIAFLQVQNDKGELEYQLPIISKKLHINFDDFKRGKYSINLLFSGENNLVTLSLDKK